MIDYMGIAILIASVGTFISLLVGLGLQIGVFIRQGKLQTVADSTHLLVNGLSEKRDALIAKSSLAEGNLAGRAEERANPMQPKPTTPQSP